MIPEIQRSAEILRRTPPTLRALLANHPDDFWTMSNYGDNTFSPFDVVGHLTHADRTNWLPRLRHILEHGDAAPFQPFDRYAMYAASRGKTMNDLLDEFDAARTQSLTDLAALHLTPADLARRGRHPDLGEVTLANLLAAWTVHDLNHTHQIAKSMAHQYRDAVGPWRTFLTILPPR